MGVSDRVAGLRPTISDVAQLAGVSTAAVSYVLNRRPGVGDETRQRVLAAADELGWQPSARARALVGGRAFAIGLVVARPPELIGSDPYFGQLLAGVEKALARSGYVLVLGVWRRRAAFRARAGPSPVPGLRPGGRSGSRLRRVCGGPIRPGIGALAVPPSGQALGLTLT